MGNRDENGYGGMMSDGRNGRGHGGMMNGYGYPAPSTTPPTVEQATQAAQKYIVSFNLPDLKIAEVMIFDNGAYVRVVEQSTGIGAFELLVDPVTQVVYPEHGANMMWNLKYGGLMHRGIMNWTTGTVPADVSPEMTVTPVEATQSAQEYLDAHVYSSELPECDYAQLVIVHEPGVELALVGRFKFPSSDRARQDHGRRRCSDPQDNVDRLG